MKARTRRSAASAPRGEIVSVAGTGLGSFYKYFASKEDLARVCLHLRSKALLMALHDAVAAHAGRPLRELVDAAADLSLAGGNQEAARVSFTIVYGLFANAHVGARDTPDLQALSRQARAAICAYLETPQS
jgi:AcrR family transcriptional regulator